MIILLVLMAAAQQALPAPPDDIVVTGERGPPPKAPIAEEDYSPIASRGSLGGLGPGSGLDPFKDMRTVRVSSATVSGATLSKTAIRPLAAIQKDIERGAYADAEERITAFDALEGLTPEDRFVGQRFALQLAEQLDDRARRETIIRDILEGGFLGQSARVAALRFLASAALGRQDYAEAANLYSRASAESPDDPSIPANLAVVYQRAGERDLSVAAMTDAIAIATRTGKPVSPRWREYVGAER